MKSQTLSKLRFILLPWAVCAFFTVLELYIINPHHYAAILRVRGDRYTREGDTENGLKAYNASLQNRGNHYFTWLSLGALREQLGDIKGAASAFAVACTLDSTDAIPSYHLSRLYIKMKRYDHALDEINNAFDIAENQTDRKAILILKAEILKKMGRVNEAHDILMDLENDP